MTTLPFILSKDKPAQVTISDGFNNSITIPSRGYVSPNEYETAIKLFGLLEKTSDSQIEAIVKFDKLLVASMLRSRFDLPKTVKDEEILNPDGNPIPIPLFKELALFFYRELGMPAEMQNFKLGIPKYRPSSSVELEEVVLDET